MMESALMEDAKCETIGLGAANANARWIRDHRARHPGESIVGISYRQNLTTQRYKSCLLYKTAREVRG